MAVLNDFITRVRALMADGSQTIYATQACTEAIRLALGEYNLAALVTDETAVLVAIQNLDGAVATTLPAEHESLLVLGGAAYAALARAVERSDVQDGGKESAAVKAWGDARLREFKGMLGAVFPGYLAVLVSGGDGGSGDDPAKTAAEIALMAAQTNHLNGQESREAAAAAQRAQDRIDEAARLADLRAGGSPWGKWENDHSSDYPEGYEGS